MTELETNVPDDKPVLLGGKLLDLGQILQSGGTAHIETQAGSAKFIDITVTPEKIDIRPSGENPFFFRAEILTPGELGMNIVLKDAQRKRDPDLPRGRDLVREAMKFLNTHQKIDRFTATWKENSDNFDQFLKDTNIRGLSDKEAVF